MKHIPANKGFSLVELLVVVVIFMTITSVVLFNQNKFSSDISNANVAYAIALQIRQAQVYGTLVRSNTAVSQPFDIGYGINFYKPTTSSPIAFRLFVDNNNDSRYTSSDDGGDPSSAIISTFNLEEGNIISDVCTFPISGSTSNKRCINTGSNPITTADIVFKRPDPAAKIRDNVVTGRQEIQITVTSALKDKTKVIKVTQTGQISVQ